ncbi:MAG TPA: tRNA uridine-5-carboxymethylaminomethyl(34) synthesis GTPase MnmE [Candidatus Binatia bacterium]|jgi:tRNA modification GTPase
MYRADTIVACATPAGRGAISIVRWSGPDALAIASRVFVADSGDGSFEPWHFRLGRVLDSEGAAIDEGLAVYFPAGRSFTGEDVVELHTHGSPIIVERLVASVIASGGRAAERGEFSRRAVLNGRLDLLQAEAIADLIDAKMAAGARAAWQQLQGALSRETGAMRAELAGLLAEIEADVDFTDDELPHWDLDRRRESIAAVLASIDELLDGFAAGRRQREGLRIVVAGRPNAGKSSLVNRLLGSERMIVSEEAGTTRDSVEESVDLAGIGFVLTDTAGLREEGGKAEQEAVARARRCIEEADLRVLVVDAAVPATGADEALWSAVIASGETIVVLNKIDAGEHFAPALRGRLAASSPVVMTSAITGEGCAALAATLAACARTKLESEPVAISRVRHRAALERCAAPLRRAAVLATDERAVELVAVELRSALTELAQISSPVGNEEVLDLIFSEFCIGK